MPFSGAPFRFLFAQKRLIFQFSSHATPTWSKFVRWTRQRVGSKALSCVHLVYECILWISPMSTTRVHSRLGLRGGEDAKNSPSRWSLPLWNHLVSERCNTNVWDRKLARGPFCLVENVLYFLQHKQLASRLELHFINFS